MAGLLAERRQPSLSCRSSPFIAQLPFINWLEYPADPGLLALARAAALPAAFAAKGNTVREGRIVTGSVFVDCGGKAALSQSLAEAGLGRPEAVEMECAGVAQAR